MKKDNFYRHTFSLSSGKTDDKTIAFIEEIKENSPRGEFSKFIREAIEFYIEVLEMKEKFNIHDNEEMLKKMEQSLARETTYEDHSDLRGVFYKMFSQMLVENGLEDKKKTEQVPIVRLQQAQPSVEQPVQQPMQQPMQQPVQQAQPSVEQLVQPVQKPIEQPIVKQPVQQSVTQTKDDFLNTPSHSTIPQMPNIPQMPTIPQMPIEKPNENEKAIEEEEVVEEVENDLKPNFELNNIPMKFDF